MELLPKKNGNAVICSASSTYYSFKKTTNVKRGLKSVAVLTIVIVLPFLVIGLGFGWIIIPVIIRQIILSKAVISPEVNPDLYSAWIHPPVPVYLKIYLFNVTNPDQVQNGSQPNLEQVGPYVFRENRTKINITHDESTDTVTYKEHITFHFEQELSGNAKLKDEVILINVPFVAAAIKIQSLPWPLDTLGNMVLIKNKEPLFLKKEVEEVLFKGWVVPFLQSIEEAVGITMLPNHRFGLFIGQNDTAQGPYTISRGKNDKESFGTIKKFKNESELNFWTTSSSCNKITGSDGTIFPPFVKKEGVLRLFNADLCRSIYLTYNESVVVNEVKGYRFTAPPSVMEDPTKGGENRCFCEYVEDEPQKCLKSGALDMGPCREGAPIATSTPYFLDADTQYIKDSGLVPNRSEHETFLEIQPMTGIILQASKRIQANLILKRVKNLAILSNVPEMLFPLTWVDECASLEGESLSMLKSFLFWIQIFEITSKLFLLAISLVVAVVLFNKGMVSSFIVKAGNF